MNEEFKNKLEQYTSGMLSEEEHQEMEQEFEKLEVYQQHLDKLMGDNDDSEEKFTGIEKLIKKAKQKSIAYTVILTCLTILTINVGLHIASNIYLNNVIAENTALLDAAIHTTMPNINSSLSSTTFSGFFQFERFNDLERIIGNEHIHLGELTARFRFNSLQELRIPRSAQSEIIRITYPPNYHIPETFNYLEQLPEATMSEISISFTHFLTVEETFQLFENREVSLDWFAVYSGNREETRGSARIGFPSKGYNSFELHRLIHEDLPIDEIVETFVPFENKVDEFMFALSLLAENNDLADRFLGHERGGIRIGWRADFRAIYNYIDQNGIQIPGVVVTGPTTELLALYDEPWISHIQVNEVTFLNWTSVLED